VKKYLAVLLGVFFILSFAVTAFAIHEEMPPAEAVVTQGPAKITLGGDILFRGWYIHNVDDLALPTHPTFGSRSEAFYTTTAHLSVDAKVSDNLRGYMELETSGGGNNNSDVFNWGTGAGGNNNGTYDSKPNGDLRFRQLWLMYTGSGLFGAPSGIKVGHMPIALGEKMFLNNERFGDDAILVWIDPTKEMHLLAGTVKLVDSANNVDIGFINHTGDLDGYVLMFTYMLDKDNTIGANWTWAHSDGNLPSIPVAPPNCNNLNFHNAEVHAHGTIGGFTYALEGDWQMGRASQVLGGGQSFPGYTGAVSDVKFEGYGAYAKVGFMIDPVNIRASFAYGSGDSGSKSDEVDEFQTLQGTDATSGVDRYTHYTLIYERFVRTAAFEPIVTTFTGQPGQGGIGIGNTRSTGIANTTALNLGFDVNPLKDLSISVDGWYLLASSVGRWEIDREQAGLNPRVGRKLGWEIDGNLNYKIAKNLSYFAQAGIFKPGGFYRDAILKVDEFGDPVDFQRKTVTMAFHGLLLEF
jgi:hypothetical protein